MVISSINHMVNDLFFNLLPIDNSWFMIPPDHMVIKNPSHMAYAIRLVADLKWHRCTLEAGLKR